jgi:hypothetical protein
MVKIGLITLAMAHPISAFHEDKPLPTKANKVGCVSFFTKCPDLLERICLANS